jgi:hypothetical protein
MPVFYSSGHTPCAVTGKMSSFCGRHTECACYFVGRCASSPCRNPELWLRVERHIRGRSARLSIIKRRRNQHETQNRNTHIGW